jgi:hypothetical protein
MERVLVVMRGALDLESLHAACALLEGEAHELAICHVVEGHGGLAEALAAQRRLTAALRGRFGDRAESFAVFVVSDVAGDTVDDLAREWGATTVRETQSETRNRR